MGESKGNATNDATPDEADGEAAPAPPRIRGWKRVLVHAIVIYIVWCTVLYFYQDHLLFPADLAPQPFALEKYDASTVVLKRDIDAGQVVAWYLPPLPRFRDHPAPLLVFCHGNAEIIDFQPHIVNGYQKLGFAILLPEYRGYGRSAGKPSERGIVEDAVYFFDEVLKRPDVDPRRIVIHGRSMGGGVAAGLAARRKPTALVLESSFMSVVAMARRYLVPPFLAKNPFRVDRVVAELDVPVLIMHGTEDEIVPVSHGRKLRDLGRQVTYHEYACSHNDFPGDENEAQYWQDVGDFLRVAGILSPALAEDTPTSEVSTEGRP